MKTEEDGRGIEPLTSADHQYFTVTMICLNVMAKDRDEAFDKAYEQVSDDLPDHVFIEPQGGMWHYEMLPG